MSRTYTTAFWMPGAEPGEGKKMWYSDKSEWSNKFASRQFLNRPEADQQTWRVQLKTRYAAMKRATGAYPRNYFEYEMLAKNLTPNQREDYDAYFEGLLEEEEFQAKGYREPARPFDDYAASRETGFERRNPGQDKVLDPVGNPNEQQRLLLEQAAPNLPAEMLHKIRPDKRKHEPLTNEPGYNSIPSRQVRERMDEPIPPTYLHQ